jgi:hypothetical protein
MSIQMSDLEKSLKQTNQEKILTVEELENNLIKPTPLQMSVIESNIVNSVIQEPRQKKKKPIYTANIAYPGMFR